MSNEPLISILIIEDDKKLASLTRKYLEQHELVVTVENDGFQGLKLALKYDFDVVLLDIMLPEMDGVSVCQKLRIHKDVPIIMLTARGEEADRVLGLEIGADDYMTKPFSPRELLARIRVQIRRRRGGKGKKANVVKVGSLIVDSGFLNYQGLDLTSYEFALLLALAENAGRVLSRDRLMDLVTGAADEAFDRSIDVHISRLRKKMGDDPRRSGIIKTIRGAGYLLINQNMS